MLSPQLHATARAWQRQGDDEMTDSWRPMLSRDLTEVVRLADAVHADFPEDRAVFADRLRHFPAGCFVCADGSGRMLGYCISHPWPEGPPPALNRLLGATPEAPDSYFIHDLALAPETRRKGLGALLLPRLLRIGRELGLARASLVAVGGSAPFWQRMGFAASTDESVQAYVGKAYAEDAIHMVRPLDGVGGSGLPGL